MQQKCMQMLQKVGALYFFHLQQIYDLPWNFQLYRVQITRNFWPISL